MRHRGKIVFFLAITFFFGFTLKGFAKPLAERSITPSGTLAGKWLITISVGRGVTERPTLVLRNELTDVFSKTKGGLYQHVLDLDDHHPENGEVTKSNVMQRLQGVKSTIDKFKADHPGIKTMVVFGLTGHGMTDESSQFIFQLEDENLSGKEIVQIIKNLSVDETLLVLQSCQSGSLVDNHFPNDGLQGLQQEIARWAERLGVILAVVTPASKYINSPLYIWEQEVLHPSFFDDAADVNGDDIVSFEEWENQVRKLACLNKYYTPETAFSSSYIIKPDLEGIDPKFYDRKMPADLPLFLTKKGISRYSQNTLKIPTYDNTPPEIFPDTVAICKNSKEFFDTLHNSRMNEVLQRIGTEEGIRKVKTIHHLRYGSYYYNKDVNDVLNHEIETSPDELVRAEAVFILGNKGPKQGENPFFDEVISYFETIFSREKIPVQRTLAEAFGLLRDKNAVSSLSEIMQKSPDADVRYYAAASLGLIEQPEGIKPLINILNDLDEDVRIAACLSLGQLKAREALTALRKISREDHSRLVREAAREAIDNIEI